MIKKKTPAYILTTALFLTLSASAWADHGENFHCDFNSFVQPEAAAGLKSIAGNNRGLLKVAEEYTLIWETNEIKRICDKAANGSKEDFTCMGGRQDFKAIKQSIPTELFGMSAKNLRPHYLALQKSRAEKQARKKVLDYCGELGVVDRSFK
jgi:hypothetical protein